MSFLAHFPPQNIMGIVGISSVVSLFLWIRPFDDGLHPVLYKWIRVLLITLSILFVITLLVISFIEAAGRVSFEDEIQRFKNQELVAEIDGRVCLDTDFLLGLFSQTNSIGYNHASGRSKHEVSIRSSDREFKFRLVRNSVVRDDFLIEIKNGENYCEVGTVRSKRLVEIVER